MSVTVQTTRGTEHTFPKATHWDVHDGTGNLWVIRTDTTIAEYPRGEWCGVARDWPAEPDDGANRASGYDKTCDLLHGVVNALRERANS